MQKIAIAVGVAVLLSACAGMNSNDSANKPGDRQAMAPNAGAGPDKSGVSSGAAANTMRPGDRAAMAPNAGAGPDKSGVDSGAAGNTVRPGDRQAMAPGLQPPMVGGAPMYPNKDIIDNAVNSKDHTTLVAAVKAAGLVETLKGPGPFTVFAPTNAAFAALPAGTVDNLLKPQNKPALTKVLTYHVVSGRVDAATLVRQINAGNGRATLRTVSGGTLVATASGPNVLVTDESGGSATVTTADVYQSNGVIHVVNKVLLPR